MSLIERKAEGEDVVSGAPEEPKPTKAPDLMAALEESIAAVKGEERSRRRRATAPSPPRRSREEARGQEEGRREAQSQGQG